MPKSSLAVRRAPRQARGVETVGRILDATAKLLDRGGLEAITTNSIAERAGINVATLYGYFPNKYAVLRALHERLDERRSILIENALDGSDSWDRAIEAGLGGFVTFLVEEPGAIALLQAIKSSPELRSLDRGVHDAIAERLAAALRREGVAPVRARTMAAVLVEASSGVVGLASRAEPRQRRRVLAEHQQLVRAYLESAGL